MRLINFRNIPNQTVTYVNGSDIFKIRVKYTPSGIFYDITVNDKNLFSSLPLNNNFLLIPFDYLYSDGNIYFKNVNTTSPNYLEFGKTQLFYFINSQEVKEFNEHVSRK